MSETALKYLTDHTPAGAPRQAYSVDEFCQAHRISRASFYSYVKAGKGPRLMKVGARTLISVEAAAEWRRQMENVTSAPTAA